MCYKTQLSIGPAFSNKSFVQLIVSGFQCITLLAMMLQCRQLIPLLSLVFLVRGQFNLFGESCEEDDFVDVDFNGCESCEHNYRNMVFILSKSDEQSIISTYFVILLVMWLCLGAMFTIQRWRKYY